MGRNSHPFKGEKRGESRVDRERKGVRVLFGGGGNSVCGRLLARGGEKKRLKKRKKKGGDLTRPDKGRRGKKKKERKSRESKQSTVGEARTERKKREGLESPILPTDGEGMEKSWCARFYRMTSFLRVEKKKEKKCDAFLLGKKTKKSADDGGKKENEGFYAGRREKMESCPWCTKQGKREGGRVYNYDHESNKKRGKRRRWS